MQKSQKKKKKKIILYGTFSFAVFLFSVIKGRKKQVVLFFSVIGEEKCEINLKKKKIFFLV